MNNQNKPDVISLIKRAIDLAIEEDVWSGDITTNSIVSQTKIATAYLIMKANGVISGLDIIKEVFLRFDNNLVWKPFFSDGDYVKSKDVILEITANHRALLTAERTALNILQRMSGIATETSLYVKELERTKTKILDTRKTVPGLRVLDKLAVKHGGGTNHRMGLYDMVMIKDNHIKIAGSITKAVEQIRQINGCGMKIEVETTNLEQVKEALDCNVDIIMLDNMSCDQMIKAVMLISDRAKIEASGNMTLSRVKEVALTGVDYISVGALTHSVTALDISMNIKD